jgi:hypothetical protein
LVIGFIGLLQLVTASKDYALIVIHTSQITTGHTTSSQSVIVFTSRCLVAACSGGYSPSYEFSNYAWPQLLASHSNSPQLLNPSGYLTDYSSKVKIQKICYDRRLVGQSVLVSSTHLEPKARFLLLSDSCGFEKGYPGPPGWGLVVRLTTSHHKN